MRTRNGVSATIIKHMIGVLYPETGKAQIFAPELQYDKDECLREGYLWVEGHCVALFRDQVREIVRRREYVGGGRLVEYLFAVLETND